MKFITAAVVLLAVAMGVQSSLVAGVPGIGLGIGGLGVGGVGVSGLGWGGSNLGLVNGVGLGGIGYGYGGLGVNNLGLGLGAGVYSRAHVPAAVNLVSSPLAYSSYSSYAAPVAVQAPIAVPAVAGSVAHQAAVASPLVPHGATYVAKNRGAIHTAPLAGHVHSAASINLAPAPGTW